MPKCTVTRTHRLGRKLAERDRDPPVPGPIEHASVLNSDLNRYVSYLKIPSFAYGGLDQPEPIPRLCDPQILTLMSDRAMMIAGFEEVNGQRYYQGWWIQWV